MVSRVSCLFARYKYTRMLDSNSFLFALNVNTIILKSVDSCPDKWNAVCCNVRSHVAIVDHAVICSCLANPTTM